MTRWWVSCPRCCAHWFPFTTQEDLDNWIKGHALAAPHHSPQGLTVEWAE